MKSRKKFILNMLEKNSDSMTSKQIRGALGLNKTATVKLKAELQKLIKDRKIKRRGNRYFLADDSNKKKFSKDISKDYLRKEFTKNKSYKTTKIKNIDKIETGYFTRTRKGFGFVNIGFNCSDVFISENEQGYAMEGDLVQIKIYKPQGFRGKKKGKIIKILERASLKVIASLKRKKGETIAIPLNKNSGLPFLKILRKDDITELKTETLIEVELLKENEFSKNSSIPYGRILRSLEKSSNLELGLQLIINENSIRTKFPKKTIENLKSNSHPVRFNPRSKRKDLRDLDFVTIDGKSARDFDDAVCVIQNSKSPEYFKLYVAIADVAHYVTPGNSIDKEALLRGTSVYFPTHAVHMLPEELSKNLCSLRPNVNRLTLTCEMLIRNDGVVEDYSIYESIIRSRARLIYEDVANLIDGKISSIRNPVIRSNIEIMNKLAIILERKRLERGSIQFSFAEEIFEFDLENKISGIVRSYQSSSMKLIEQFMLEANETVAKHCVKNKIPTLFRVHEKPDMRKLKKLQKTFFRFGIKTPIASLSNPKKFNEILKNIKSLKYFEQLQFLLLRSMALAVYEPKNRGHFGLAAKFYTHFTSPIRRYPDLVVHRALKENIHSGENSAKGSNKIPLVSEKLADICSHLERKAEKAERQSLDLVKVDYLASNIGQIFNAVVTSVEINGFRINIVPQDFEWFLPLESIPDDTYVFDKIRLILQSRRKKHILQVGQRLEILLLRADPIQRSLEFKVEKWVN